MMKENMMFEHEHPFSLIDLWSEQLRREEESEEDEEEKDDVLIANQDFQCLCSRCGEDIKWYHRYYYSCCHCSDYFVHKFCAELPQRLEDVCEVGHALDLTQSASHLNWKGGWTREDDWNCKICVEDQISKNLPRCRVCRYGFSYGTNVWMYKCEKCRYYTHLGCATSRNEPFMSIFKSPGTGSKNYKDDEHPYLLHLPFPDPSYSILKHLFFKKKESSTLEISNKIYHKPQGIIHKHPLILEDITIPTSSRIKPISYHDPMKRIQLLCDGCVRPITSGPIYVCDSEGQCNFVLHEWCSQLPAELKDHPAHRQHTLVLHSKAPPRKFFGVFRCGICRLHCNGFAYCCMDCNNCIFDVHCAFLPKEITHTSHPNHLLFRVHHGAWDKWCRICGGYTDMNYFSCHTCNDFRLHANCALFIPETTWNKCDKHPMKLSYFPIENHKSDYFCEVCERELNPEEAFYHCHECMQSMHTACAPSILQYETYDRSGRGVYEFVNVKFGGRYENSKVHPHPLSFVQGIQDDGECADHDYDNYSGKGLRYNMIFKCLDCKFAVHYVCLQSNGSK
ncbi:putative chromatin regulator PHD family [Helianthus annuus]|nr:putative chromatin regulator PHD family [Helianthus annuus]